MNTHHTFRFGVQVGGSHSGADWKALAHKIEDLGYSTLFMPDHFIETELAPMVGISVAAATTDRLRVGMLVLGNDYKHPAVVAKESATLDLLSEGRLELGIGAGWMKTDYEALGLPYDTAGTRINRLAEAISVIKGAWRDSPFDFDGEHYTIRSYDGLPKPVQRPHPPILVGGGGPRLLRLAGKEADIVGINPNLRAGAITSDALKTSLADQTLEKIGWVRDGAGARFADIELQIRYFIAAITHDANGLAEAMAPGFGVSASEALQSGVALVGTVDEVCDTLTRRREEWGVSYVVLGDDTFEAFAPVVARLAGT
ncbi:MAG TPA: TIGR03621 family F420-dependent LLM class oxidoreductase [Acidimicrobiia bacterium]|nr:TIGR03621 family F420-dependent LLM class oxidoreductase [Acidimicrobiia bacterium]